MQPSPANKIPTVHILGLLSNLFSTFDLNKQSERLEVMRPVQTQPHNNNPVWQISRLKLQSVLFISKHVWIKPVKWTLNSTCGLTAVLVISQVVVVLQQAFPLIQTVLNKWLNEPEVLEVSVGKRVCMLSRWKIHFSLTSTQAVCAVFEKSLKTLIHDFAPLVSQLCELIGQMFGAYPQASALDLTRQVKTWFTSHKTNIFVFAC